MKSLRIISGSVLLLLLIVGVVSYRAFFIGAVRSVGNYIRGTSDVEFSYGEFLRLKTENVGLSAEIQKYRDSMKSTQHLQFTEANVYSRYPASERQLLVVDKGSEDGIALNMPVFADSSGNLLLGKVSSIKRFQSEIQTLWDAAWKTSVEVGASKTKALYVGGTSPHLEFIPKESPVGKGDRIGNINPDFPLSALVGTVGEIEEDSPMVWKQASVTSLFSPDIVERVYILKNFP